MCHPRHLCFILSAILCIRAAYRDCDDEFLDSEVRSRLRKVILRKESQYSCKAEERVAEEISLYTLNHKTPVDVMNLVKRVNYYEKAFFYNATYFKSQDELYDHMKNVRERVGCANLQPEPYGYLCLIKQPICSW